MPQLTVVAVGVVLVMRADGAVVQVAPQANFFAAKKFPEALDPSDDMIGAALATRCIQPAPAPADVTLEQLVAACLRGVLRATGGR